MTKSKACSVVEVSVKQIISAFVWSGLWLLLLTIVLALARDNFLHSRLSFMHGFTSLRYAILFFLFSLSTATQLLGVLLAAASNLLISVSLNIQKCAHLRLVCRTELKPYYTSKLWWCGITLLGLGEVGNFAAYGFAPIALVTPLGCVSVIGSAFISVFFLKKTMRTADILGGTLTVTGTYLLVTFAPNVPQELTARQVQNYLVSWPFLVYSILLCLVIKGGLLVVHQAAKNHGRIVWLLGSTRFGHRTAISVPTPLLLLGLPQEAEADVNTDLCTPSRAAIRDSYVLLIILLGCFLSRILEILIFCILLYFYKRKAVKHIVVLLMMVALLASMTVIAVKAVSSMITLSVKGKMQLTYSIFYIMVALMASSCAFQVKFLNQAMHLYEATAVVPINFVFFTTSAIISGVIFYREFQSAAFLSVFMFLFGCLLSFLGVFIISRNKKEEHLQIPFIDCGHIPGHKLTGKIQPDSHSSCYGTLNKEDDSVKSQS